MIFNAKSTQAYPETHYFSYATLQTSPCEQDTNWCPNPQIENALSPTASVIGHIGGVLCDKTNGFCFGEDFEANDGLVPLRSSISPQAGLASFTKAILFTPDMEWLPGAWYWKRIPRDHGQIVGNRDNYLQDGPADNGTFSRITGLLKRIPIDKSYRLSAADGTFFEDANADVEDTPPIGAMVGGLLAVLGAAFVVYRRRNTLIPTSDPHQKSVLSSLHVANNPNFGEHT